MPAEKSMRPSTPRRTAAMLRARPGRGHRRRQDGELVAAEPERPRGLRQPARQLLGQQAQQLVAAQMAGAVVDQLEPVDVEQRERADAVGGGQRGLEGAAVLEPGERVARGLLARVGQQPRALDQQRRLADEQLHPPDGVDRRQLPVDRVVDPDEPEHLAGAGGERQQQRVAAPAAGALPVAGRAVQVEVDDLADRLHRQQVGLRDAVLGDHRALRELERHRPAGQAAALAGAGDAPQQAAVVVEQADGDERPAARGREAVGGAAQDLRLVEAGGEGQREVLQLLGLAPAVGGVAGGERRLERGRGVGGEQRDDGELLARSGRGRRPDRPRRPPP